MAKIYIDSDFNCHTENDGTMIEVDNAFFDGKCKRFIEGYRYIPGVMFSPRKPYNELAAAQAQYELDMAEATAAYQEGVDSAYDQ